MKRGDQSIIMISKKFDDMIFDLTCIYDLEKSFTNADETYWQETHQMNAMLGNLFRMLLITCNDDTYRPTFVYDHVKKFIYQIYKWDHYDALPSKIYQLIYDDIEKVVKVECKRIGVMTFTDFKNKINQLKLKYDFKKPFQHDDNDIMYWRKRYSNIHFEIGPNKALECFLEGHYDIRGITFTWYRNERRNKGKNCLDVTYDLIEKILKTEKHYK